MQSFFFLFMGLRTSASTRKRTEQLKVFESALPSVPMPHPGDIC